MRATQMANPAAAPKDLLAEANLSANAQRKADWGIIKEMSRYLWPKVVFVSAGGMGCCES